MSRGRLIHPSLAEILRPDVVATETKTPIAGSRGGPTGYDKHFRTPILQKEDPTDKKGIVAGEFKAPLLIPAQVEVVDFEDLRQQTGGNVPDSRVTLVFHAKDLEDLGLIKADGTPNIPVNSKLNRILDINDPAKVELVPRDPPGLYLTHIMPSSFGLTSRRRNLFIGTFDERATGALV